MQLRWSNITNSNRSSPCLKIKIVNVTLEHHQFKKKRWHWKKTKIEFAIKSFSSKIIKFVAFSQQMLLMLYFHPFVFSKVSRIEFTPLTKLFFPFNASVFFLIHFFFSTGRSAAFHVKRCC